MARHKCYGVRDGSSATYFDEENGFIAGNPQLPLRMFPRDRPEDRVQRLRQTSRLV